MLQKIDSSYCYVYNNQMESSNNGKINTGQSSKDALGPRSVQNVHHEGGQEIGRQNFEDRLDARLEEQKMTAQHAAKKFKETGLMEFSEDGKFFYVDSEAYKANILGYFWAFIKGKGSKLK